LEPREVRRGCDPACDLAALERALQRAIDLGVALVTRSIH
jgi:hypothetical protein